MWFAVASLKSVVQTNYYFKICNYSYSSVQHFKTKEYLQYFFSFFIIVNWLFSLLD